MLKKAAAIVAIVTVIPFMIWRAARASDVTPRPRSKFQGFGGNHGRSGGDDLRRVLSKRVGSSWGLAFGAFGVLLQAANFLVSTYYKRQEYKLKAGDRSQDRSAGVLRRWAAIEPNSSAACPLLS